MDIEMDATLQWGAIIHIGLPKCASTTLQNLFTLHQSLTWIDDRYTSDLLIDADPLEWDGKRARNAFSQLLAEARDCGTIPVISDERLAGNGHPVEVAHRLHSLMPHTRILICIREQISMLASNYKHFVRCGSTLDIHEFLRRPDTTLEYYKYTWIIRLYQSLFGRDNVCIKLLEELRDTPEDFFTDIYRLLGVAPCSYIDVREVYHGGLSDLEAARLRWQNFLNTEPNHHRFPNPFDGRPINKQITEEVGRICAEMTHESVPNFKKEVRSRMQGWFAESNRELSDLIGKDLTAYGYEVAPKTSICPVATTASHFTLQPTLLMSHSPYREHHLVRYRDLFYALPWQCKLEGAGKGDNGFAQMSVQEREALLHDRDLASLKRSIDAKLNATGMIMPDYRGYAIVHSRQRYYAILLRSGLTETAMLKALSADNASDFLDFLVCDSASACQATIEDEIALRKLEEQPHLQALQHPLSEFLQMPDSSQHLFGLPPTETWACFRLLWNALSPCRHNNHITVSVAARVTRTAETLLQSAQQSSAQRSYSFAACAASLQMQLLHDSPAHLQIAVNNIQLQTTLGNWESAEAHVQQLLAQEAVPPGGYAVLLCYQAALLSVQQLFAAEALNTRIAQRAFALLRDLNLCFLHCPFLQTALISTLSPDDAPSQAAAFIRLGEALLGIGLPFNAEPALRVASALAPENAVIQNNLAVVYWQIAKRTQQTDYVHQAQTHIEQALHLDPNNTEVLVNAEAILQSQP